MREPQAQIAPLVRDVQPVHPAGEIQAIAALIRSNFAEISREYNRLLPSSYVKYSRRHDSKSIRGEFGRLANHHSLVIQQNFEQILSRTAVLVSEYLHIYHVQPNNSVCQYKLVYFIGMAIAEALDLPASEPDKPIGGVLHGRDIVKIHMYSMIGWLHYLNEREEVDRALMSKALIELVDNDLFDEHLGSFGAYLLYKCRGAEPNPVEV